MADQNSQNNIPVNLPSVYSAVDIANTLQALAAQSVVVNSSQSQWSSHLQQHPYSVPSNNVSTSSISSPVNEVEKVALKKESHKEIERRRRENISEGIKKIADMLPSRNLRNKAQILEQAHRYIMELQELTRKQDLEITTLKAQIHQMSNQNSSLIEQMSAMQRQQQQFSCALPELKQLYPRD